MLLQYCKAKFRSLFDSLSHSIRVKFIDLQALARVAVKFPEDKTADQNLAKEAIDKLQYTNQVSVSSFAL